MASKFFIINKYIIRKKNKNNNINRYINKIYMNDIYLPIGIKFIQNIQGKQKSKSIIRNKCLISGRARAVINKFKMSRMIFKKYGEFGLLNGIRKATW